MSKREMWKQFEKCWFAFSLSAMPRPFHLPGGGGVVLDFLPLLARFIRLHPIGVLLLVCLPRPSHHILAAWLAHLLPNPPIPIPAFLSCQPSLASRSPSSQPAFPASGSRSSVGTSMARPHHSPSASKSAFSSSTVWESSSDRRSRHHLSKHIFHNIDQITGTYIKLKTKKCMNYLQFLLVSWETGGLDI